MYLGHTSIRLGPFGTLTPPIPSPGPCTEGRGPSGSVGNGQRGCGERPTSKLLVPDSGPGLALGLACGVDPLSGLCLECGRAMSSCCRLRSLPSPPQNGTHAEGGDEGG